MSAKNILKSTSWFIVNKAISKIVGVEAALFLSYLCEKEQWFTPQSKNEEGWFYLLSQNIEEDTTLSYRVQKTCISKLEKSGFIKSKLMGIPRKLYFSICENSILQNVNYINAESATIEQAKAQIIYKDSIIKNQEQETIINNSSENEKSNFKKWTLEDFQNEIRMHRGAAAMSQDEAMNFYNYWSESGNGKMRFQLEKTWETAKRMATWQSRARTPINGQKSQGKTINAAKDYLEGLINE